MSLMRHFFIDAHYHRHHRILNLTTIGMIYKAFCRRVHPPIPFAHTSFIRTQFPCGRVKLFLGASAHSTINTKFKVVCFQPKLHMPSFSTPFLSEETQIHHGYSLLPAFYTSANPL